MARQSTCLPTVGFFTGLVTLLLGAVLAYLEIAPFFALSTSEADRFRLFAQGELALPVAEVSRAELLGVCYTTAGSLYARAQPTVRRRSLLEACHDLAAGTTRDAPTLGLAWLIGASSSGELDRRNDFNHEILTSVVVAPREQWLAELRVDLVERYYTLANEAVIAAEVGDLKILLLSQRGISSIAQRYVDQPDFRERVADVVATLPAAAQRRFVDEVKRGAQALGGSQ